MRALPKCLLLHYSNGLRPYVGRFVPTPRAPVTSVVTVQNTGNAQLSITGVAFSINIEGLYTLTANTCSFVTPLPVDATCTFSVTYATAATQPLPDVGLLVIINNGSGTVGSETPLALRAR